MIKINKFFFYLGLFTVNAFRNNWKLMLFSASIIGIPEAISLKDALYLIPCSLGAYLAAILSEYIDYKNASDEQ